MSTTVPSYAYRMEGMWVCCNRARRFTSQLWWDVGPNDEYFILDGRESVYWLHNAAGQRVRTVRWETPTRRLGRVTYRRYLIDEFMRERGMSPGVARERAPPIWARDLFRFAADELPKVTQAMFDAAGAVWVRRFDPTRWPEGLSRLWDVFDKDGHYVATWDIPLDFVYDIGDQVIVGTVVDSEAMERIHLVDVPLTDSSYEW